MVEELHAKTIMDRQTGIINKEGNFNLWDNEEVAYNGESAIVDIANFPHISIIVNAYSDEANTTPNNVTLEFLASADGEHFTFCSQITQNLPQGGTSEAHIFPTIGARYVRLRRNDTDTQPKLYIKASLQAKP